MLTSVAVLADIHGVLPALDAVLAEPAVRAADRIAVAGDHVAGPQPCEVLDRLRRLGDRVLWVRGNADRELIDIARGNPVAYDDPIATWAAHQLRPDDIDFIEGMPARQVLEVAGLGRVLVCHATPRDNEELVLVDSRVARWSEVLAGVDPDIVTIVCGHTHMPFLRLFDRRTIVNPGSVGMPYGSRGAHWAMLEGEVVSLHRTAYDYEAACASIVAGSSFPDVAAWADEYVYARNGDLDALAAFGPRDGRGVDA